MIYAVYYSARRGEERVRIKAVMGELRGQGFLRLFLDSFWALLTPVIILGSIYGGIATPTEAAVISVYYALFVSVFIYKTIKVSEIPAVFMESLKTIAPILFVLSAAVSFGRVLALMNVPQMVGAWITSSFSSKWTILLVVNIFLLFVGMVMDAAPAILILTPILAPVMTAIGVDLVHFGIMMVVNLAVGFVTPPVGINLFVCQLHDQDPGNPDRKGLAALYHTVCHRPSSDRDLPTDLAVPDPLTSVSSSLGQKDAAHSPRAASFCFSIYAGHRAPVLWERFRREARPPGP